MVKVGLIISSPPGISETFISAKVAALRQSNDIELEVFCDNLPNRFLRFRRFISILLRIPFAAGRIYRFYTMSSKRYSHLKKAKITINNLHILTYSSKLDYLHFAFGNLIHHRPQLGHVMGSKTSLSLRGYDITYYPLNHPGCYDGVWKYIDKIHFNSQDLYDWALKWGAPATTHAVKIPAAVDNHNILQLPRFRDLKVVNKACILTSIGRLHWKKGFDLAIFAVRQLVEEGLNVHYSIYGNGPELEKLRFLIAVNNLEANVTIHPAISHNRVIQLLDESTILIAPSLQEGCSNICLEAQARGLYCVVSDAEGMREVIVDGATGAIVPKGDSKAIAAAIKDFLMLNPEEHKKIGENAIMHIRDGFSRDIQIRLWVDFFSQ
jgi:colanic acid/amylovoran biosynthesis glycosyltransferase